MLKVERKSSSSKVRIEDVNDAALMPHLPFVYQIIPPIVARIELIMVVALSSDVNEPLQVYRF